ncbi:MAG: hypothetical protein IKK89_11025 [Alistipes sp.]|nr:hypothetical protein [Alistipes sp.]
MNIIIRRTLPLKDMMQFVENVVSSCVDAETASYTPEIKEFAIRSEILTTYANFNLPSNVEKQYELLYCTDVLCQVMEHINNKQLHEIEVAIDARIDHEVKMIETVLAAKTNEMMLRIEAMVEQFEAAFGGINSDDFNGVVKKLSEMDSMTEESIAKAVLDVQRNEIEAKTNESEKVVSFPKKGK